MILNDVYCIYKGLEYRFSRDMQGNCLIITDDENKVDNTFRKDDNALVYSKDVKKSDLERIYSYNTIAKIGDIKVHVDKELENSYLVGTGNTKDAEKLGLSMVDKYYFVGEIPKDGVIIEIEKDEIYI
jgi:hypothetical protein